MKIQQVRFPQILKATMISVPILLGSQNLKSQDKVLDRDVFEKSKTELTEVADSMLESPAIKVGNDTIYPAIVIDLSENKLYQYDTECFLENVYPVASGKKSTPTTPGLRIITGKEEYPYKNAPKVTKRAKNPNDYGTNLFTLAEVDTITGKVLPSDGRFLHGTFNPKSIGKYVSKGCIRLNNENIQKLTEIIDKGQYVLIKE